MLEFCLPWGYSPLAYSAGRNPSPGSTTNMQLASKLTAADLNDVPKNTRSNTYWHPSNLKAIPKLLIRACAALIALASTAAVFLVAALSVGCYGIAKLLARVPPFRDVYQFLSGAYDRLLYRLAQKVL